MTTISIQYCFKLKKDSDTQVEEIFNLHLDEQNMELKGNLPKEIPFWAKLDFFQCPNCSLDTRKNPYCPVAANIVNIVDRFNTILSYKETRLIVITKERMIIQDTTVQRAVSSLMGLVMATSGCPHTVYFKPMARFHLPLANNQETIYRAASMYLLFQYFINKNGKKVDFDLNGLEKIYSNIQTVNFAFADRLRAATKADSVLNALVELDIYAQTLSIVIEDSLEDLKPLFEPFLSQVFPKKS